VSVHEHGSIYRDIVSLAWCVIDRKIKQTQTNATSKIPTVSLFTYLIKIWLYTSQLIQHYHDMIFSKQFILGMRWIV